MGGSHQISKINEDIRYGDLSAVLMQNSAFLGTMVAYTRTECGPARRMGNEDRKLAQITANENVTSIAGVPTLDTLTLKRILEIKGKT